MALNKKDKEILKGLLEKREKSTPLTHEEDKLANQIFDKLISAKRSVLNKNWYTLTGDQFRKMLQKQNANDPKLEEPTEGKGSPFAGTLPKDQGFKGGHNKEIEETLEEETTEVKLGTAKAEQTADEPFREYDESEEEKVHDEVEGIEDDDPKGEVKADARDEDYGNTDEKEHENYYEEDRIADYTGGKRNVKDDIKTKGSFRAGDLVIRELKVGKAIHKEVGVVQTVSSRGGLTVLWKSTMTQTFETPDTIKRVYRGRLVRKEDYKEEEAESVSPPVEKAEDFEGAYESNVGEELPEAEHVEKQEEEDEEVEKQDDDVTDEELEEETSKLADKVIKLGRRVLKLHKRNRK